MNELDQMAQEWNQRITEHCAEEIQALEQATIALWEDAGYAIPQPVDQPLQDHMRPGTPTSPSMHAFLTLLIRLHAETMKPEYDTERHFVHAAQAFTRAVQERTLPPDMDVESEFVLSRYLSIVDKALKAHFEKGAR